MKKFSFKFRVILGVALLACVLVIGFLRNRSLDRFEPVHSTGTHSPLFEPGDKASTIYYRGIEEGNGRPLNVAATIRLSKSRYNQMKQAVLAYLQGPRKGAAQVPVPEGLTLNEFYFTPQGAAVVDLSVAQVKPASFGFYEEAQFIRGMVEVLAHNFFEVKQVKILVDGQDAPTLGGHYALGTSDVAGAAPAMTNPNVQR